MSTSIKARLGRFALARAQRTGVDLSKLPFVPRTLTMPLRRDGVDPVPELGRTRDAAPVVQLDRRFGMNIWLVSGYDECRAVLTDTTSYSTDIRHLVSRDETAPEGHIGGLGFTDPPDHTRLRRILTPEFTRRRLARLEPSIRRIVDSQLDDLAAAGPTVDLVSSFAFPVPSRVIGELLGLPPEFHERFRELGPARFDVSQGGIGSFGAVSQSRSFFLDVVRQQRADPGEGLIGQIIRTQGQAVDDVELAGLADGVFTGGYETTASMLALGALVLVQGDRRVMTQDQAGIDRSVEELLRYLSVVQISFPRFARHDLALFGQSVAAGDVVVCSLSGANRDTLLGTSMNEHAPDRTTVPHLAFGHGLHRCIGAELARMELRVAYPALLRRFPRLRLAVDPERLNFRRLSIVYGVDSLPVRLW